ncbi:MAG: hypothetical protein RLN96_08690, partial [Pseudomonadales bacterium]
IDGAAAGLSGTNQQLLAVSTPSGITDPELLSFQATVTDNNGTSRTGVARIRVVAPPGSGSIPQPTATVIRRPTLTVQTDSTTTISTDLTNPSVVQSGGSVASLTTTTNTDGTTSIGVSVPAISTNTEQAEILVQGTDANGDQVIQQVPILVVRAPSQAPPVTPPQQVPVLAPSLIPDLLQPLRVISCGQDQADEGQQNVILGVCASGGTGQYSYSWNYVPTSTNLAITLNGQSSSHPNLNIPGVANNDVLMFDVEVVSGSQTVTTRVFLAVWDKSSTLTAGSLADVRVNSGDLVSLNSPRPQGGIPPYDFSVSQTSGAPVGIISSTTPQFSAPTLAPGADDVTLTFEYLITDAYMNQITVSENVIVQAPPAPFSVSTSGPSS